MPPGYRRLRRGRGAADEEEELLQLAIQQSLMDQEGGGGLGSPNEVGVVVKWVLVEVVVNE